MKKLKIVLVFILFIAHIPFTLANTYKGCYEDRAERDMNGFTFRSSNMTNKLCSDTCSARGFKYAATQYSSHCFCDNSFGSYGTSNNCNMTCSGNSSETCGGPWANNIYLISSSSSTTSSQKVTKSENHQNFNGQWRVEDARNGKNQDYHGVPWTFKKNGKVDAKGYWRGLWETINAHKIRVILIDSNANTDQFDIAFSEDNTEFTAFKNGKPYRYGIRK